MNTTATAHQAWDQAWQTDAGRAGCLQPEPDVIELASSLRMQGKKTALDLGCGVGRHALAMAALGFETTAFDASSAGLAEVDKGAAARALKVQTAQGDMSALPFEDGAFDYVLSFNVIYHGDETVLRKTIAEISRVLRPGGIYQGTMLSKRRFDYGVGNEISRNTWVQPDGTGDKKHPHYFCDGRECLELFGDFEVWSLKDVDHKFDDEDKKGSWHWHLVAQKN